MNWTDDDVAKALESMCGIDEHSPDYPEYGEYAVKQILEDLRDARAQVEALQAYIRIMFIGHQ